MTKQYIGREKEFRLFVEWLNEPLQINEDSSFPNPTEADSLKLADTHFLSLEGPQMSGKSTFLDFLWPKLQRSNRLFIWIRPFKMAGFEIFENVEILSNNDRLNVLINNFKKILKNTINFNSEDKWIQLFATEILAQISMFSKFNLSQVCVIFVLDNYSNISIKEKEWFLKNVFSECAQLQNIWDIRFILSNEYQDFNSLRFYWPNVHNKFQSVELKELSGDETRKLLSNYKLDDKKIEDLYKKTGGLPGKLLQAIELEKIQSNFESLENIIPNIFNNLKKETHEILFMISHLRNCSVKDLNLLFKNNINFHDAIKIFEERKIIDINENKTNISINGSLQKLILSWQLKNSPDSFQKHSQLAKQIEHLKRILPDEKMLSISFLFVPLNFFSFDFLKLIYPEEFENLKSFVQKNINYFYKNSITGNYKMLTEHLKILKLISEKSEECKNLKTIPEKLKSLWETEKQNINKNLSETRLKIEEHIKQEVFLVETSNAIEKQILSLSSQIKKKKEIVTNNQEKPKTTFFGLLIIFTGIFLFYFGTLFRSSLLYGPTGVLLIVLGLFWPSYNKKFAKKFKITTEDETPSWVRSNIKLLTTKLNMLYVQRNRLINLIASEKRLINKLEQSLNEPFVEI